MRCVVLPVKSLTKKLLLEHSGLVLYGKLHEVNPTKYLKNKKQPFHESAPSVSTKWFYTKLMQ